MILHTLSAGSRDNSLQDCLRVAQEGDAILLLGDGVYCAIVGSETAQALQDCPATVMALGSDVHAAGLAQRLGATVLIDMDGFAGLTEYYPRQLAWY